MSGAVKQHAHRLGLRIAIRISLILLGFLLLICLPFIEWPWSLAIPFVGAIGSFFASYFVVSALTKRRLANLQCLMNAIREKKYDEIEGVEAIVNDELDEITEGALDAAFTVRGEFQRLVKLENYRKDFIGDISHELKTPIFAIQGFIETLLDGAIEDKTVNRQFLEKAMRNVNRLNLLTRDLMEIAKLETGELRAHIQPIPLHYVLQEVAETLAMVAEKERVSLKVLDVSRSLFVLADRNQLKQVLLNLVENGIKYNKPGGSVTVGLEAYGTKASEVTLFVRDTGIGIDKKDIERVTERFYRVDKSRSRDKGGTGLGLSIVKHILESHGSKLQLVSETGVGSTFSFSLRNADRVS